MSDQSWVVLDEIGGSINAEIFRGLLEAQGIPVVLSQEGAGHFGYPVTFGRLGQVQVLVPAGDIEHARQILEQYEAGEFDSSD